jgi:hypothetical protein
MPVEKTASPKASPVFAQDLPSNMRPSSRTKYATDCLLGNTDKDSINYSS